VAALCARDTRSISFMWILCIGQLAPLWFALPPPWHVRVCLTSLLFGWLTMHATMQLYQMLPVPMGRLSRCDHIPAHTPLVFFDGDENKMKKWLSGRRGDFIGHQPVFWLNSAIPDICTSLVNAFRDSTRNFAYPSTGCVAVFLAAQVCNSISLYGFGPDDAIDAEVKGLNKLYSATGTSKWIGFHDFIAEHALYRGFSEAQTKGTEFWQNRMRELNQSALIQDLWRNALPWLTTALHCVSIRYPGPGVPLRQVPGVCGKEAPNLRFQAKDVSQCVALGGLSLSPFVAILNIEGGVRCELFATCHCAETLSCPSAHDTDIGWTVHRTGVTSKQREEANVSECWDNGREHTLLQGLAELLQVENSLLNSFGPGDPSVLIGPAGRHDTCALVGSGTELMNQGLGRTIDAHDQVWRLNIAP